MSDMLRIAIAVLAMTVLISPVAAEEWVANGIPVITPAPSSEEQAVSMIPDGEGGAFLAWRNTETLPYQINFQKIGKSGNRLWGDEGVANTDQTGSQHHPVLCPDEEGGFIVAYAESDITAQRYDADGSFLWDVDGEPISRALGNQDWPAITADGAGGAIIAWLDFEANPEAIYVQKINAAGSPVWTTDGVFVAQISNFVNNPSDSAPVVVSDGAGGAYIAWVESTPDPDASYVKIQRVDAAGNRVLEIYQTSLFTTPDSINDLRLVPRDDGGVYVFWSSFGNLYGQRLDHSGATYWPFNHLISGGTTVSFYPPAAAGDETGGAFVAWTSTSGNVQLRRVHPDGSLEGPAAWRVDNSSGYASAVSASPDGQGNVIVSWTSTGSDYDILARVMDGMGNGLTLQDIEICGAGSEQVYPLVASDGAGSAIIVWNDYRNGNLDLYAQRLDRHMYWGLPSPELVSTKDVPGDQGGYLYLAWDASRLDPGPDHAITSYSIWRALDPANAAKSQLAEWPGVRAEVSGGQIFYWEEIASVDAHFWPGYAHTAATLYDSTSTISAPHYFQVVAETSDPKVFWASEPDSGWSVDNLAPGTLEGLMGNVVPAWSLELAWSPNRESDLAHYVVHRSQDPDFIPSSANLVGATSDTLFVDDQWDISAGWIYKVAAVDIHENVGLYAALSPAGISAVGDVPLVSSPVLSNNFPNPFNPKTTIAFDLPDNRPVRLTVFDVTGRIVKVLIDDETAEQGRNEVVWRGRDMRDRVVSAGIYFYRLEAGDFSQTKKMTLLK